MFSTHGQKASPGKRLMRRLPVACLFTLASCRMTPSPAPVPLEGRQEELSALAGEWTGQYWSKDTGRRGVIRFAMPEAADTGHGEVEITFSPTLRLVQDAAAVGPPASETDDDLTPKPCTVLNIRVVRVEHDGVRGTMEPYWDPDCDCRAQTVFEGKVAGDRITGTFTSRRQSSDRRQLTGQWQVDRER
jgi:hypothetical protein